jgi:urease accessory protein
MLRATAVTSEPGPMPFDIVVLTHDERHLRRKLLTLQHGDQLLVDLPEPVVLAHGDRLVLDDGRHAEVIAAEEALLEVRADDSEALMALAWHIGNRHLPAQIEADRILVARDHVIEAMLLGLGASVREVSELFQPVRGAYHGHRHGDDH